MVLNQSCLSKENGITVKLKMLYETFMQHPEKNHSMLKTIMKCNREARYDMQKLIVKSNRAI